MTDIDTNTTTPDTFDSFIENVKYDITDEDNVKIILNGEEEGNTEEKIVGVEFEDGNIKHKNESLYWIKSNGSIVHSDEWTEEIRTFEHDDLTNLTTIYITGVKVSSFDSWDKLAFSSDFVVFGKFL